MALAEVAAPPLIGHAQPRISPPVPARSDIAAFREVAADMGITLMPWQDITARYLTATDSEGLPLYREVCVVVARQNGKTHLMKPFIIQALKAGKRVMHIAQNRELPRQMFKIIADELPEELFLKRRGKGGKMHVVWPRFGSGSEEIETANGGAYRIAASSRGGARGVTNDIVIIDELREMETDEVIAAAEPTLLVSPYPQLIYLSNAGTDASVVLNAVRDRAGKDDNLAYLEWSASPERAADDRDGWAEANPALGHIPTVLRSLEDRYTRHSLVGTLSTFETEYLCRWVTTMREPLVRPAEWNLCEAELVRGRRRFIGVSMDPSGMRASVALAWQQPDGRIALRLLEDVTGSPIDVTAIGQRFFGYAQRYHVINVGFDPMTDGELAKHFRVTKSVSGADWANASSTFVNHVESGRLRWSDGAAIGDDLTWTARKEHDETGKFVAVRANDDRPITAALAAIRAVWLASGKRTPIPRIC